MIGLVVKCARPDIFYFLRYQREKLKQRRPKPSATEVKKKEEEKESYQTYEEPGWAAKPLGQWQTIPERCVYRF